MNELQEPESEWCDYANVGLFTSPEIWIFSSVRYSINPEGNSS